MQKQDYAGLSRTFDAYFPDVKGLVEKTEQFYKADYAQTEKCPLMNYDNTRLIGTFTLNKGDHDTTLPRLYFEKKGERTNPNFYIITRPTLTDCQERIIHVGTSVSDASQSSCSVSALTGGVMPYSEKKQTYSTYLKIMSTVKNYGYCNVYEIPTGYEDINIKGLNGKTLSREVFAKQIFSFLGPTYKYHDMYKYLTSPEEMTQKEAQNQRDNTIWQAVVSFKNMVENASPEMLKTLKQLREAKEATKPNDGQEITITQDGLNNITFTFKNKVELLSPDEFKFDRLVGLEKVITPSARILCQTGDTVYEQYTSYIAHKVKNGAKDQNVNPVPLKQTAIYAFEKTFIEHSGANEQITFKNIFLGNLQHDPGLNSRSVMSDGGNSAIELDFGKTPSLKDIKDLTYALETLFGLDPNTTKVTLAF